MTFQSLPLFFTRLYADYTSLTASGYDLDSLLCEINNHLPTVYEWLRSNKLTLNLTKLSFLFYAPSKGKLQSLSTINCSKRSFREVLLCKISWCVY